MYIYESHMGGVYTTDEMLDYEDTYCESCGDSDWCLGYAETKEDAYNILKSNYYSEEFDDWTLEDEYIKGFLGFWEE